MPAILAYLCEKHDWEDLYPKDVRTRARVNQYLHMHHNATREATFHLMAPHVTVAFYDLMKSLATSRPSGSSDLLDRINHPDKLELGGEVVAGIAGLLENGYFYDGSSFLCTGHATIADIACYEELGQLCFSDLFDFEGFPKVRRWLDAMRELPFHEQAHRYNSTLGDIRTEPNTAERFLNAGSAGLAGLEECGVKVSSLAR
jgi:glutathione S-transferase